jgi:hypothetical protein
MPNNPITTLAIYVPKHTPAVTENPSTVHPTTPPTPPHQGSTAISHEEAHENLQHSQPPRTGHSSADESQTLLDGHGRSDHHSDATDPKPKGGTFLEKLKGLKTWQKVALGAVASFVLLLMTTKTDSPPPPPHNPTN